MRAWLRTFWGFGAALLAAWLVILVLATIIDSPDVSHPVWFVFGGFVIGWLFAACARKR